MYIIIVLRTPLKASLMGSLGLNLNFEFESAHKLLMHLNLHSTFAKSMNLNLNVLIKHSTNLIFSN